MKWSWDKFGYYSGEGRFSELSAESKLLGCLLLMPELFTEIAELVRRDDFREIQNRELFDHMANLKCDLGTVDISSLIARLKAYNVYEQIGGAAYLAMIVASVPHASYATYYAHEVRGGRSR